MPSLTHQLLTRVIPVLRRSGEVVDAERLRRDIENRQPTVEAAPARRVVRGCDVVERTGHPMPVFDVVPRGADPTHAVLYLHGGGFVSGIDRFHWRYAASLARRTGRRVVLPAYPLTPRHSWRDALPALSRVFEDVAVGSPDGVALMGDSAGGGLALSLAQRVIARPGPRPTHLVLLSPWVDLAGTTPGTEQARSDDPWLTLTKLRLYGEWWAGGDDPSRPEVSPLHGELAGLPPMLVLCGTRDLLVPQVRELVRRARAHGGAVEYHEEPGLLHVYPLLPVPEARVALRDVVRFLGPPPSGTAGTAGAGTLHDPGTDVRVARFDDLDVRTSYRLWQLRESVFVVEQHCPYPELDGRDAEPGTWHVWVPVDGVPVAYLRVLDDGDVARIGRVVVAPSHRGQGLAGVLMRRAHDLAAGRPVVLDAQAYLADWYAALGYRATGPEFLDDGIPHVPMRREPDRVSGSG